MQARALTVLISTPLFLFAAEFWQQKNPSEWTDKEVNRLLTKSPWAKEAVTTFDPGGMRRPEGGGPEGEGGPGMAGPGGPGGQGGPGMGGPGMGGPGGEGGQMEPPKFTVRWESAAPVRAAAARAETPASKAVAEWVQEFYVVTVSGSGPRGPRGGGLGRGDDPERQERMKAMRERMQSRMKEATSLTVKGKGPIAPARVERIESENGQIIAFLFPRTEAISGDAKEVAFESAMGPMKIKARFTPAEMTYHGKLEM